MKSAIFGTQWGTTHVYTDQRRQRIASLTDLHPVDVDAENLEDQLPDLADLEVIFSTWGMPTLNEDHLDRLPRLKALFYAAGSVQQFARPLLDRDIAVHSAWQRNADFVARMTTSLIVLACKGYFRNTRECARPDFLHKGFRGPGIYHTPVAILGVGAIGRRVAQMLHTLEFQLLAFDPFLPDEHADQLHIEKVSLTNAFRRGIVVTNHLAAKPETADLVTAGHLAALPTDAAFINTGRPQTVNHQDLLEVFTQRDDLTAMLDVIEGVPRPIANALRALPNVLISSHIAGTIESERTALADAMIDEFLRWRDDQPTDARITPAMLARLA